MGARLNITARPLLAVRPLMERTVGLTMMNGIMERLSNRKWRAMLGRFLFGREEVGERSPTGE